MSAAARLGTGAPRVATTTATIARSRTDPLPCGPWVLRCWWSGGELSIGGSSVRRCRVDVDRASRMTVGRADELPTEAGQDSSPTSR